MPASARLDPVNGRSAPRGPGAGFTRRRGQSLIEFALAVTFLVLTLVGVADFGRAFYFDIVVSAAAAQGARAAALGAPDAEVVAAAQGSAPAGIGSALAVTVSPPAPARTAGTTPVWTTVTVTYTVQPLTFVMRGLFPEGIRLSRSVSQWMRRPCVLPSGAPC